MAAAVVAVVAERGYEAASVGEILARSGSGSEEFAWLFDDKEDAVTRVFEVYIEDFKGHVGAAYDRGGRWPASLRAAAYAVVAWIDVHPDAYRFGMVEVLSAGEMARVRREELFLWCAELIDEGRGVAPEPTRVPEAASLIAVGAVVEILTRHAAGTVVVPLAELVPELMYGAVRPYLGEDAARAELAAPGPEPRSS